MDDMRGLFLLFLLSLFAWTEGNAQLIERDSVWINDIISNGGEYKLNQETLDAIRNGTLLNGESIREPFLQRPELPISKEFDTIGIGDNVFQNLYIYHLPSSATLLYQWEPDAVLLIRSAILKDIDDVLVREYYRIPHTSIEIIAPGADLQEWEDVELINGEWKATLHPRTFATFSAEDALEDVFEPSERQKRKNRKNANAWKTYNMQDMDD